MADPQVSFLDETKAVVIAGFVGSVLSLAFVDQMTKRQRIVAVISGMVMAHYLAPMIAFLFNEEKYQETIGFLVGLFGMSGVAAIFRGVKNADLWSLVKRRYGTIEHEHKKNTNEVEP